MATRLELPALGQTMEEGTITRWFKTEGEAVNKGEALYEVMTDKVNMEVEATEGGVLRKILVATDETVLVGAPVAVLGTADEDISALIGDGSAVAAASQAEVPSPSEEDNVAEAMPASLSAGKAIGDGGAEMGRVFASPRARRYADEYGVDIHLLVGRGTGVDGRVVETDVVAFYEEQQALKKSQRVSPLAQKVAAAHGVPLGDVPGSGHGGKVTQDDVRRLLEPQPTLTPPPPLPQAGEGEEEKTVVKLTGMRKMVADAVARSAATAPHVTLTIPVDMSEATRFRQQVLPAVEKTYGVRLSFTDIVAKATARALTDHPTLNSTLQGDTITQYRAVHLGIAVSLGAEGLIVPVVKNAQSLSLGEFSVALKGLAAKAKAGTLASDDVTGGTFSITNLGTYGVTQFNPIINPPQAAILGVCTITESIVPIDGQPQVRPMMNLCLSFDHRVTDGAPAAAFLARLKEILEQPYLMFA
jgi:pyruvate dehydrogenase E2 component (dihydrolipoamide acetyltransferase)